MEDEYGLDDRGDSVGTAAELPKEPPALQHRDGLLDQATDLGVTTVVSALPLLAATASERDVNVVAGSLVRLVRMVFIASVRVGARAAGTSIASRMQRRTVAMPMWKPAASRA